MRKPIIAATFALAAAFSSAAIADPSPCPVASSTSESTVCSNTGGATINSVRARGAGGNFAIAQSSPVAPEPRTLIEVLAERYRALSARLQRE